MRAAFGCCSLALFLTLGCGGNGGGSDSQCPDGESAPSNLALAPAPEAAVAIHPDGRETSWQWQLQGALNTVYDVDVYDVDLFDTAPAAIAALQTAGRTVVCYFSAGSSEDFRPDFEDFASSDKGSKLGGFDGERWLDIRSQNVLDIMTERLDLAVTKGCDGVEPDNMDGYTQDSCFDLSAADQLAYNRAIANLARARGLAVGLKNDPEQVPDLVGYFDFSVSEQCFEFDECASYSPFVTADKPVFNAEYRRRFRSDPDQTTLCDATGLLDIRTLVLDIDLDDSYRFSCD